MSGYLVVFVTCPTVASAKQLAKTLVHKRLAACVNIVPNVQSLFWWEGRVDQAREALLLIKTTTRRFASLRQAVRALHPYEVPEVIAIPIQRAHQPYLRWITESLRSSSLDSALPRSPRAERGPRREAGRPRARTEAQRLQPASRGRSRFVSP